MQDKHISSFTVLRGGCTLPELMLALLKDRQHGMVFRLVASNGSADPELAKICLQDTNWSELQRTRLEELAAKAEEADSTTS